METYSNGEVGDRPWGHWHVLDVLPKAIIKRIDVNPGHRLSLQKHNHRSETWCVASGVATVVCGEATSTLHVGESIHIPKGCIHRISNESAESLSVIEIQMGDLLAEDDIERFEDDYQRSK